jgi:UDP-glucose 4-epimerase
MFRNMNQTVLVTGGAGFIGSHTCIGLLAAGHRVVVVDNLCNSQPEVLEKIQMVARCPVKFYQTDVRNREHLERIFRDESIQAVIHFAGLKAVGESVSRPLDYYENNVSGSVVLVEVMEKFGVKTLVFSSSATVYGEPTDVPISEKAPVRPVNPYGRTKAMVEDILRDVAASDPAWRIALLRYFNPVGAHHSGLLGEDPRGIPNNLMPYLSRVAAGELPRLSIFGNDYPTPDGTGVRDYIHVLDLVDGHLAALRNLESASGVYALNLGTGQGYSVLDMVRAFERASGRTIAYEFAPRRAGDIATCYADPGLAEQLLGWRATRGLEEMCIDTWRWQCQKTKNLPS